jgi:phosphoglycolate phosphatase
VKQGLIFDLDGTLVDSLPGIAASLNHALAAMGLPGHVTADVRSFIGDGSWILSKRAAPAGSPDEAINAIEQAFKAHYDLNWIHGTVLYPGIAELLGTLRERGHPLAILSNKPHPFVLDIAAQLFPGQPFAAAVGQQKGIPHKPDPAGIFEITRILGLPPEDCILIGDSTIDIATSRNAGIRSIAVTWGYHDREPLIAAKPGSLIDEPAELLGLLG